jgi:hypothetical protein
LSFKAGVLPEQWSPLSIPLAETLSRFYISTTYVMSNLLTQPLDSIAEYFGEAIAFYFAYTAFYTRCLVWPAIFGVIVFAMQLRAGSLDHWLCLPYSIFVMIWACLMLALWGQQASTLAYRWGMLDFEAEEVERPQFKGNHMMVMMMMTINKLQHRVYNIGITINMYIYTYRNSY